MKLYQGKNKDFNIIRYLGLQHGIIVSKKTTIKQIIELIKQRKVN
jgi:hypothetical protein